VAAAVVIAVAAGHNSIQYRIAVPSMRGAGSAHGLDKGPLDVSQTICAGVA